jgi:putative flippase GtrA
MEVAKYFVVGGVCTLVDFTGLFVLTQFFEVQYLISSALSFLMGATLNYFLCTTWIFDIRLIQNRHHEFMYYILITTAVLIVNTGLIWMFTEFLDFYFMMSKVFALAFTFCLNFSLRKYLLHSYH